MTQGDGTGPQGQDPRSGKNAGRGSPRGRKTSQQGRGGRIAGRRQEQGTGKSDGSGQGKGRGRAKGA
jgi:hypothetical protein